MYINMIFENQTCEFLASNMFLLCVTLPSIQSRTCLFLLVETVNVTHDFDQNDLGT